MSSCDEVGGIYFCIQGLYFVRKLCAVAVPQGICAPAIHDFWELLCVDKGEIDAIAGKNRYTLKQGNIIFLAS